MIENRFNTNRSVKKAVTFVTAFFVPVIIAAVSFSAIAESKQASLEQRIKHLEELNQTRNKVQADMSYQLSELQREIRDLTGQVEENTYKLKQIQDRQRDLYRDIENRLSGISNNGSASTTSQPVANTTKNTSVKPAVKTTQQTAESNNARREFEAAFALVRNKDYTAAVTAFEQFLVQYPNSNYSANARYWMGQVYLVQANLKDAQKQFEALITEFPKSAKADAAKLKLGDIFLKQEKWEQAKTQYTSVANSSSGAQQQLARKGLDKLKQAGH